MNISERYRELVLDVRGITAEAPSGEGSREQKLIGKAAAELTELEERVGEIPRIQLESKLTPVLLKAHSLLDRARLLLDEQGAEDQAAAVWDLEQKIYRLLNAL